MSGLEWQHPSVGVFSVEALCPRAVKTVLETVVESWLWSKVANHLQMPEFEQGPILAPIKAGMSKLRAHERAYVVSAVSGGQRPQDRQCQLGLSSQQECPVCATGPGALLHRHVGCAGHQDMLELEQVPPACAQAMVIAA
eukprot:1351782-Pyramimonas_sp.AAC.1